MTPQVHASNRWTRLPRMLVAIISGLLIAMVAANVWPVLLLSLGAKFAAVAEVIFLALYVWWARGGGPPASLQAARAAAFRSSKLSSQQWLWGLLAALFFAATIHASLVLLFRLVVYPVAAFREGYDLSIVPSQAMKWVVVVISAASAGICEETGFRGYMQQPIEQRHGAPLAILISSLFFMALHLSKAWAIPAMVPIVFGAGILLGLLAWAARSLIPCILGHILMDIGLFAYWWTGVAGEFRARPITETGVDSPFFIALALFAASLSMVLFAVWKLRKDTPASGN